MLRTNILAAAAFAALSFAALPASAATNLVQDGSFNNPISPGTFTTYNNGQSFGSGNVWTVNGGSIDEIGNYWLPPIAGGGTVDLAGLTAGSIMQSIAAPVGSYNLSFYLSGNPDGGSAIKHLTVSLLSGLTTDTFNFSYDTTGNSKSNMNYILESLNFNSHGNPITLQFASTDGDTPFGAVIGGVSVSAVPEPATWTMLLLGFGAIGWSLRSRGRKAVVSNA